MIWALGAAGLVAGALLPTLIAKIPDRVPADGEPPGTPYRELAASRRLSLLLALVTAVVWAAIALSRDAEADVTVGVLVDLIAYLVVGALGVAMAYVDLREYRLPDWLTFPAFGVAAVLLAVSAAVDGEWGAYGRAWAAAGICVAFYLLLALLRPSDLGLGDVKLGGSLGLLLGWVGWSTVILGVFLGFLAGAVVGVVLLVARRATRRSSLPFGPPMLVGALAALLWTQLT